MVSLFGRGFDSLQLHHLSKRKPLTFKQLAASLYPASPVFSVFGDALGDAKRVLLNPIWQLFSYFLTQLQIIKKLKNALLLRFYLPFSFLLSFLPFTCFYMKLQMWVVFWLCHSINWNFLIIELHRDNKNRQHPRWGAACCCFNKTNSHYETSMALVTFSFGSVFGMVTVRMPSSTLAEIWSFTTSSGSV